MYLNKTQIIGNITRDVEIKALPSGVTVANFSVATNRTWKNKEGVKQEEVEYHNVIAFGKTAEVIGRYMKKGSSIYIEGRLKTRNWQSEDGKKNYRTEILLENFQFGAKASGDTHVAKEESQEVEYPADEIDPEDIPF